ncbi:MAG TPA: hypothetical protein VNK81_08270 [Thermodesulfobacteriota bacterium]|nr:hypothetical protein [Thermodesulfobacteriota bacterium]
MNIPAFLNLKAYNRDSRLKPSTTPERESPTLEKRQDEPKDTVRISSEARKKLILEEAKSEVIERIRKTE